MRCAADDCDRRAVARGLCNTHWARWKRTGDPNGKRPHRSGASHYEWLGDACNYRAVHDRLRKQRGRAAEHYCRCGKQAQEWAYRHGSDRERRDDRGRPFSPDLSSYDPMCCSCHRLMDKISAA